MKEKLTTLTRRLEELEMRNQHEVQAVNELPASHPACFNCQSSSHPGEHCPLVSSMRDLMQEHAYVLGQNKPPKNAPYGNTYNPNWRIIRTYHGSQNPLHILPKEHNSSLAPPQHSSNSLHLFLLLNRQF